VLALLSKMQAKTALTQMIGRVLRQPGAKRTGVDDLDCAWVYCSDLSVKDAVDGVRKGLDEEGMGDLRSSVRGGDEIPAETHLRERRPAFKAERILIPRVTHLDARGGMRPLDFDGDILGAVEWEALHYDGGGTLNLDDAGAARARASFDYGSADRIERVGAVERAALGNAIDRPDLARRLLGLIPNPWIGIRLVDEGLASLRARGIDDVEIAKGRLDLLDSIRAELEGKVEARARAIFEKKLADGTIAFKLTGHTDWIMPETVAVEFRRGSDLWMRNDADHDLERTLFLDALKQGDLNQFEHNVALYLDGSEAIAWWWRVASRGDWGLQGWRRHKVYPDFLMRLSGDGARLMLLETKGKQLDNEDTGFKRDLMAALEAAYAKPSPGEVELFDESPDTVRFKMLMQDADWKTHVADAIT
jgi:type III restriction enzyme